MLNLPLSLQAWNTEHFSSALKQEIAALDPQLLPLQQGLQHSSYANGDNISAVILNTADSGNFIEVKVGIFYSGIIAGCNCADDPSPVDEINEYCELLFSIDKQNATATVALSD